MGIPKFQFEEMLARLARNKSRIPYGTQDKISKAVEQEMSLHSDIIKHCRSQWPEWLFIRSRSDMESTIAVGCQDFTVFLPGGRVVCMEIKSRTGKLSNDQLIWREKMRLLGHEVHEVRSMAEFLDKTKPAPLGAG